MIATWDAKQAAISRALERSVDAWIEKDMEEAEYMLSLAERWQDQPQSYFESEE